jgi:hypothetical protein
MSHFAARDFEDILQVPLPSINLFPCVELTIMKFQNMRPVVDGLLPGPHNRKLTTLPFHLAEWHALAKLRMHTEATLDHLERATVDIGKQ